MLTCEYLSRGRLGTKQDTARDQLHRHVGTVAACRTCGAGGPLHQLGKLFHLGLVLVAVVEAVVEAVEAAVFAVAVVAAVRVATVRHVTVRVLQVRVLPLLLVAVEAAVEVVVAVVEKVEAAVVAVVVVAVVTVAAVLRQASDRGRALRIRVLPLSPLVAVVLAVLLLVGYLWG